MEEQNYYLGATCSLCFEAQLSTFLWEEMVCSANHVFNHCSTCALIKSTPLHNLYGYKPHLGYFRTIDCLAYVHILVIHGSKLALKILPPFFQDTTIKLKPIGVFNITAQDYHSQVQGGLYSLKLPYLHSFVCLQGPKPCTEVTSPCHEDSRPRQPANDPKLRASTMLDTELWHAVPEAIYSTLQCAGCECTGTEPSYVMCQVSALTSRASNLEIRVGNLFVIILMPPFNGQHLIGSICHESQLGFKP